MIIDVSKLGLWRIIDYSIMIRIRQNTGFKIQNLVNWRTQFLAAVSPNISPKLSIGLLKSFLFRSSSVWNCLWYLCDYKIHKNNKTNKQTMSVRNTFYFTVAVMSKPFTDGTIQFQFLKW